MTPQDIHCNICNGSTREIKVQERMLGLKEVFTYNICNTCGHAHLANIPENLARYYNANEYYSFKNLETKNSFVNLVKKTFFRLNLTDNVLFSRSLKAFLKTSPKTNELDILDFGCGSGFFVKELQKLGFKNAVGYDPFLTHNKSNGKKIILSNDLELFDKKQWDVITLNHVLEHLPHPLKTLQQLKQLLKPGGFLLLRFPVIDSFAFEKYKEKWVQFDAPRHLNLFTRKSITSAVGKVGEFKIITMYDDSYHFQFTGSELYEQESDLSVKNNNRKKRLFSLSTYKYHFMAKKLNRMKRGDQIVVILEKN